MLTLGCSIGTNQISGDVLLLKISKCVLAFLQLRWECLVCCFQGLGVAWGSCVVSVKAKIMACNSALHIHSEKYVQCGLKFLKEGMPLKQQ